MSHVAYFALITFERVDQSVMCNLCLIWANSSMINVFFSFVPFCYLTYLTAKYRHVPSFLKGGVARPIQNILPIKKYTFTPLPGPHLVGV